MAEKITVPNLEAKAADGNSEYSDNINIKYLIRLFLENYLPKQNTYHNRGDFFWAKQTDEETPEEIW